MLFYFIMFSLLTVVVVLLGGDDRRVLLWNVSDVQVQESPNPIAVMGQMHYSNIFSLAFSN